MEAITRIFILADAGHYRDSLVALLRTIPCVELVFLDSSLYEIDSLYGVDPPSREISSIILVDMDSVWAMPISNKDAISPLIRIKSSLPKARMIALADNLRHTREAQGLDADCILPRGISAGDFLRIIQDVKAPHHRIARFQPALSLPSSANL